MKHFFLFLLLIILPVSGYSQKINRQYSFHPQEGGNVYFIHPQKGFSSSDKETVKELVYDITYVSNRDSATFIFSYYTSQVLQATTVRLKDQQGNILYESPLEMMFTQPQKSYWQQRAQFRIPYVLLEQIYREPAPYSITLGGKRDIHYNIKNSTWKKQSGIINKIFEVVEYNR